MPCLSNFESWNCILTWFLLSASVFVNEVEEGGSNILLLDLFICCLSNLTIVRFLLLAFKLWFTLNHLSWFSSSGDIVLILWRRPEVRTPIIPVSFHYTKVTVVSLCIRDSRHRWTWDHELEGMKVSTLSGWVEFQDRRRRNVCPYRLAADLPSIILHVYVDSPSWVW